MTDLWHGALLDCRIWHARRGDVDRQFRYRAEYLALPVDDFEDGRLPIRPNRRGVWARFDHTPFGAGRPYSSGQVTRLLRANMFTPLAMSEALGFPPMTGRWWARTAPAFERVTRRLMPAFAGAIVVSATKQLYQGLPVRQRQSRRVFVPVLAPQGATKGSMKGTGAHSP